MPAVLQYAIFGLASVVVVPTNGRADTQITPKTDCRAWRPNVLGASADCEIVKNRLLHAEGKRLEEDNKNLEEERNRINREREEAAALGACYKKLILKVEEIKSHRPLTQDEKIAFKAQKAACENH